MRKLSFVIFSLLVLSQFALAGRYYDARIGRFLQIDPKAHIYPNLSPYVYTADNPIKYIDPDGKEIVLSGPAAFQRTALSALQKLTNDKLTVKNGVVYITKLGGQNTDKKLDFGTNLIRDLNKKGDDAHTVTISKSDDNNAAPVKSTSDAQAKGKGSDSDVLWNPQNTTGGRDVNGGTDRPAEVGLGHELVHAQDAAHGTVDQTITGVTDPDSDGMILLPNYEMNARIGENQIRKEQGVPQRMGPMP